MCLQKAVIFFFFFFHYEARACPYWKASFKFKDNCSPVEIRGVFSGIRALSSEAEGPVMDSNPHSARWPEHRPREGRLVIPPGRPASPCPSLKAGPLLPWFPSASHRPASLQQSAPPSPSPEEPVPEQLVIQRISLVETHNSVQNGKVSKFQHRVPDICIIDY